MGDKKGTETEREDLRDGEGPPDSVQSLPAGQEEGHRQQYAQLPHHGDQHGQEAVAQGLKHGAADDAEAGEGEADGDDPQGGDTDGQQVAMNRSMSTSGKNWKTSSPTVMMHTA